MRFLNKTGSSRIEYAIIHADQLLKYGSKMCEEISLKNDWKYNTAEDGKDVFGNLNYKDGTIEINFYKSVNPWSAAIAYFDGKAIYFNTRKFGALTLVDIVATLLHEYSHYCGYSHGNNYKTKDKCLYSVPYYLSENVARWL